MSRETPAEPRWAYWLGLGLTYCAAAAVLWIPSLFLATGVQAIGRAQGWWIGDSNANDGEEVFATAIGAFGTISILAIAAAMSLSLGFAVGRPAASIMRHASICTLVVIAAHVAFARWAFNN